MGIIYEPYPMILNQSVKNDPAIKNNEFMPFTLTR